MLGADGPSRGRLLAPIRARHPALDAIRHEIWDDNGLGNAIPGATPRARIDVRTFPPGLPSLPGLAALPLMARAGQPTGGAHARPQPLDAPVSGPGHIRPAPRPPRARSCATTASLINRDFARAWLPQTLGPGARANVPIEIPALEQPGRYR